MSVQATRIVCREETKQRPNGRLRPRRARLPDVESLSSLAEIDSLRLTINTEVQRLTEFGRGLKLRRREIERLKFPELFEGDIIGILREVYLYASRCEEKVPPNPKERAALGNFAGLLKDLTEARSGASN